MGTAESPEGPRVGWAAWALEQGAVSAFREVSREKTARQEGGVPWASKGHGGGDQLSCPLGRGACLCHFPPLGECLGEALGLVLLGLALAAPLTHWSQPRPLVSILAANDPVGDSSQILGRVTQTAKVCRFHLGGMVKSCEGSHHDFGTVTTRWGELDLGW